MTHQLTTYTEATDPLCLTPDGAAALLHGAPWRRFLTLGDSLAAGIGGPTPGYESGPWSRRVLRALRTNAPDTAYVDLAVQGATTVDVLESQLGELERERPDLVHVSVGANDLWRRDLDLDGLEERLDLVFARCVDVADTVGTFTLGKQFDVPQVPDFRDKVRALNEVIRARGAAHGIDVIEFWDHPVTDRPNLLSDDGIHFAAMGQAVLAAEVVRSLARVVARG